MSALLRRPATYLALPMLLSCAVTWLTYALPDGYLEGIVLLALAAAATCALDAVVRTWVPSVERFRHYRYAGTRDAFLAMALAAAVTMFCIADVVLFPIPLFSDPASYATLSLACACAAYLQYVLDPATDRPAVRAPSRAACGDGDIGLCVPHRGDRP